MSNFINFKKPNYIGTTAQMTGLVAEIATGSAKESERSLAHRQAVAESIRGHRVRVVRIEKTRFIIPNVDAVLADGVQHDCFAHVIAADPRTGEVMLAIEA